MSLSLSQSLSHTIVLDDDFVYLQFPGGEIGNQSWVSPSSYIRGKTADLYAFGEISNVLTLDYNLCTNISGTDINDFIENLINLLNLANSNISLSNLNLISTLNATTVPLGITATFAGGYEDISEYSSFSVIMFQDVEGTLNLDYSSNGVDLDLTRRIPIDAGGGVNSGMIRSQYMKMRYENGSDAQSVFRMQTMFHKIKSKENNTQANLKISQGDDVILSRQSNIPEADIGLSRVAGSAASFIQGTNSNLTTTSKDIWNGPTDLYPFLSAATTIEIEGFNAADTLGGAGANAVRVFGLDENFDEIFEDILLVGVGSSAATTQLFLRVNLAAVVVVGTTRGSNYDILNIQASGGGSIVCLIGGQGIPGASYGSGLSQMAIYTVPNKKILVIRDLTLNIPVNKTVSIFASGITNPDIATSAKLELYALTNFSGTFRAGHAVFETIQPKTDIWFHATTTSGITSMDLRMYYYLVDELPL